MTLASHSTGTMCCHINTGFGDSFTDVQTIFERKNFTNKTPVDVNLTPVLTVPAGETLHIRILPWHEAGEEKSGKYICVKNFVVEGQCFSGTDLDSTSAVDSNAGSSRKVLENGQILILHGDDRFTVLGTRR